MLEWKTVVARHSDAVWRTVYRLTGREQEAADCYQEAFLAAFEFSRQQRVRDWGALLRAIATRRAMDQLRRRLRQSSREVVVSEWETIASRNPGPVQQAESAEFSARLRWALSQLPSQQAEVFCLRVLGDMSYRATARQLGLGTSAVGVLLHRARRRLGELLAPVPHAHEARNRDESD